MSTKAGPQPRQAPPTTLPAIAGTAVVALALPIFLLEGWRVKGWALGAVLWIASVGFGLLLHRLHTRTGNLAAAGVAAFGMMFRAIAVMVVVFATAASDPRLGGAVKGGAPVPPPPPPRSPPPRRRTPSRAASSTRRRSSSSTTGSRST